MSEAITPHRRRELAAQHGLSDAYLYQCITGRRDMAPEEAVRIESLTAHELRRWDLCPKKWRLIWPELVGTAGAPASAAEAKAG